MATLEAQMREALASTYFADIAKRRGVRAEWTVERWTPHDAPPQLLLKPTHRRRRTDAPYLHLALTDGENTAFSKASEAAGGPEGQEWEAFQGALAAIAVEKHLMAAENTEWDCGHFFTATACIGGGGDEEDSEWDFCKWDSDHAGWECWHEVREEGKTHVPHEFSPYCPCDMEKHTGFKVNEKIPCPFCIPRKKEENDD